MSESKQEEIPCPNYSWGLFRRSGVYYADGRKHGRGKQSLGTRDRSAAIAALFELDQFVVEDDSTETTSGPSTTSEVITVSSGWERYIDHRDLPIHLGGLKP